MSKTIATLRNVVTVKPFTRHVAEGIIPGANIAVSRVKIFVPYEQLRAIADALHDLCDVYEEADRKGQLAELVSPE